jgi:hypothetical protein
LYLFIGVHLTVSDAAICIGRRLGQPVVSLSGLDVRRRAPFDCQEQVGGWESFFHGANKAVRICGLGEFFFERQ